MFATKIAMTQVFSEDGRLTPVTVLQLKKNVVCGVRTKQKDSYDAVIIGQISEKSKTRKSLAGQFEKIENVKKVREIKATEEMLEQFKPGNEIGIESLKENDEIKIYGISKGKGFAGTVKRHSFNTGPKTHGSHNYRQPGSIGDTGPQHVVKGKKMAGHMGHENVTVKSVRIVRIEKEKNRIWVKGPVPGANKSEVFIQK